MNIKKCARCNKNKSTEEFDLITRRNKAKTKSKKSLSSYCKSCKAEIHKTTYDEVAKKQKFIRNINARHNMSIEEYQDLFKAQNGKCAICKRDLLSFKKRPAIDHCHITGKNRGLLCNPCNSGIGFLGDNYETCLNAAMYLAYYLGETTE